MIRNKKFILASMVIATVLLFISSCCDEPCYDITNPECENYDPCYSVPNAEFQIIDTLQYGSDDIGRAFITDTFFQNKEIAFRALHENKTYEWKIGTDTSTWHNKYFTLLFEDDAVGDIPVRLITTGGADDWCLGDYGRDTFYRTIYLLPSGQNRPIYGTYTGFDEDNPDVIYDVIVKYSNKKIVGLNNCHDTEFNFLASYRGFVWDSDNDTNCNNPKGYGELAADHKTLTIRYNVGVFGGERTEKIFTGIKN